MTTPKKDTIVFDIDGTLSLVGDRVKCLEQDPPNWDEFYNRCGEDLPNPPVVRLFNLLQKGALIDTFCPRFVFLTGRRESVRGITQNWLYNVLRVVPTKDQLLMRPDGDFRHDTVVKPELLALNGIERGSIITVFEDRDSMVKWWRQHDVPCFQVAEGNF